MTQKKNHTNPPTEESLLKTFESQQKPSKHRKLQRRVVVLVAVLVTGLIGGYVGYKAYSGYRLDQADKQRFKTAEKSVKNLHTQLQQASAPGVTWEFETYCREGSVKFQEPLKTCHTKTSTASKIIRSNDVEVINLIRKYYALFEASPLFKFKSEYKNNPPDFPNNFENGVDGAVFIEKKTNMGCSASFRVSDLQAGNEKPPQTRKALVVSFDCDDYARELHYSE